MRRGGGDRMGEEGSAFLAVWSAPFSRHPPSSIHLYSPTSVTFPQVTSGTPCGGSTSRTSSSTVGATRFSHTFSATGASHAGLTCLPPTPTATQTTTPTSASSTDGTQACGRRSSARSGSWSGGGAFWAARAVFHTSGIRAASSFRRDANGGERVAIRLGPAAAHKRQDSFRSTYSILPPLADIPRCYVVSFPFPYIAPLFLGLRSTAQLLHPGAHPGQVGGGVGAGGGRLDGQRSRASEQRPRRRHAPR